MVVNARVLIEDEGEKLGVSGREQTERMYGAAIRLSNFVDDLLQYARTGNRSVNTQRIDLSEMLSVRLRPHRAIFPFRFPSFTSNLGS